MILALALAALAATSTPAPRDLIELVDLAAPAVSPDGEVLAIETRQASIERNAVSIRWRILRLDAPAEASASYHLIDGGDGGEPISRVSRGQVVGYSVPQIPQWSSDSQWFAYWVMRGEHVEIWRSHRDGRQEPVVQRKSEVQAFCWSSDGTKLIFSESSARSRFERQIVEEGERGYLYDQRFAPYYSRAPIFDADAGKRSVWVHEFATGAERLATAAEVAELEDPPLLQSDRFLRAARTTGVNPPLVVNGCNALECTGYFQGVWRSVDERILYFVRWTNGRNYGALGLYRWLIGSRRVTRILETDDFLDGCTGVSRHVAGEQVICAHESATTPRKLVTLDLATGRLETLYDPNPHFRNMQFGDVTPATWHDAQGIEGFGHIVKPVGYRSGQRYPLIIVQYRSRGFLRGGIGDEYPIHLFASAGYSVLSFHRPKAWDLEATALSHEDVERQGFIGLRDRRRVLSVLDAGIEHLIQMRIIDPQRIGITCWVRIDAQAATGNW